MAAASSLIKSEPELVSFNPPAASSLIRSDPPALVRSSPGCWKPGAPIVKSMEHVFSLSTSLDLLLETLASSSNDSLAAYVYIILSFTAAVSLAVSFIILSFPALVSLAVSFIILLFPALVSLAVSFIILSFATMLALSC